MATQAQDVINNALRKIAVIASGESAAPEELTDGLTALNQMLGNWNIERLDIFAIHNDVFNLSNGVQDYTLGSGGTLNATRPVSIKNAYAITSGGLSFPMQVIPSEDWAAIVEKTISGTVPRKIYCDFAYPLANVHIFPVPSGTPQLSLYSWQQLTAYANLTDNFDLPPGYWDAIVWNLALRLASEYGRPAPPEVAANAATSLNTLKMYNRPPIPGVADEQGARAAVSQSAGAVPPPQPTTPMGTE